MGAPHGFRSLPELAHVWIGESRKDAEANVEKLVREFWVSAFVVLRRARDLGKIAASEYEVLSKSAAAKLTKAKADRGTLTYRDGARLVGVKVPALLKMASGAA